MAEVALKADRWFKRLSMNLLGLYTVVQRFLRLPGVVLPRTLIFSRQRKFLGWSRGSRGQSIALGLEEVALPLVLKTNTPQIAYDLETGGALTFMVDEEGKITRFQVNYPACDPRELCLEAGGSWIRATEFSWGGKSNGGSRVW